MYLTSGALVKQLAYVAGIINRVRLQAGYS